MPEEKWWIGREAVCVNELVVGYICGHSWLLEEKDKLILAQSAFLYEEDKYYYTECSFCGLRVYLKR